MQECFAQRLSTREPEVDPALRESLDPDDRNRYYRSATLERVLELLLKNITLAPAPNLAHYILGYNIENVRESDLTSQRIPLHIIVDMVNAGISDHQGTCNPRTYLATMEHSYWILDTEFRLQI